MIKILFLIHDLGQGGAEKVLVNLVNNMDRTKFDISVTVLFGGGVNEPFLAPDIHFRAVFPKMLPANSHLMKLMTPQQLHSRCVPERYDIEVSYLEGPSARVISGCTDPDTRLVCWLHTAHESAKDAYRSFRSRQEAELCYGRFHRLVAVSEAARDCFSSIFPRLLPQVCYNTLLTGQIRALGREPVPEGTFPPEHRILCAVGSLKPVKRFDMLLRIQKRLREAGLKTHLCILGQGPLGEELEKLAESLGIAGSVTFLGYQTNPYQYVAKCDLLLCSSRTEGFSTAATEALILGVPVCTVELPSMREMLGTNSEYGLITENNENALYEGIHDLLTVPGRLEHYRGQAQRRGRDFSTEETVRAVEAMLEAL